MFMEFVRKHRLALSCGATSVASLGWCLFADLGMTPWEVGRVVAGLAALWLPLGGVFYVLLRDACPDPLARGTLSATASYALTSPLYLLFGDIDLALPGFQTGFYVL